MMNTVVIQAETQGTVSCAGCIMQTTPTPGPRWLGSIATTTAQCLGSRSQVRGRTGDPCEHKLVIAYKQDLSLCVFGKKIAVI